MKQTVAAAKDDFGGFVARLSADRIHLQHGPIDLIVDTKGTAAAVQTAQRLAARRFKTILPELVDELPQLRQPVAAVNKFRGATARRMWQATHCFSDRFITPMAAVAGSVADEILTSMRAVCGLTRVFVNNGGDIALWSDPTEVIKIGVLPEYLVVDSKATQATVEIAGTSGAGGVATSGWRGRSQSLGIADAVTVFAADAAMADAAATLVANAVDIESSKVLRQPANEIHPDSDLGGRLITTAVDALNDHQCDAALSRGVAVAADMHASSRLLAATLFLQGRFASVGDLPGSSLLRNAKHVC